MFSEEQKAYIAELLAKATTALESGDHVVAQESFDKLMSTIGEYSSEELLQNSVLSEVQATQLDNLHKEFGGTVETQEEEQEPLFWSYDDFVEELELLLIDIQESVAPPEKLSERLSKLTNVYYRPRKVADIKINKRAWRNADNEDKKFVIDLLTACKEALEKQTAPQEAAFSTPEEVELLQNFVGEAQQRVDGIKQQMSNWDDSTPGDVRETTKAELNALSNDLEEKIRALNDVIDAYDVRTVHPQENIQRAKFRRELQSRINSAEVKQLQKSIKELLVSFEPVVEEIVVSADEKEVVASLTRMFEQRQIPLRKDSAEYDDQNSYFEAVAKRLFDIAAQTLHNALHDASPTPRFADYTEQPMSGPAADFDLLDAQITYDARPDSRVKNYSAIFDYFGYFFTDPKEKAAANEFAQDWKEKFRQISIWHKRAHIRRSNDSPAGPEGALAAYEKIYKSADLRPDIKALYVERENATEFEKRMVEALGFASAVWSTMSLKRQERKRLWPGVDNRVKKYFTSDHKLKKEFDVLPRYRSTDDSRLAMIRTMILDIEKILDPSVANEQPDNPSDSDYDDKKQQERQSYRIAELVYAQSENLRIGSGIEAFYDASFKADVRNPDEGNVSVQAQEGEPKAANLGLYVESAWANAARPDFIKPIKDQIVHGFTPFLRAAQFTMRSLDGQLHNLDHWGDGRATLAEIMSVKDGLKNVSWGTGSTNPDKTVFQAAFQAVTFLFPQSQISKAVKPENRYYVDVLRPPLKQNFLLNREDEINKARLELGWYNPSRKVAWTTRVRDRLYGEPSLVDLELNGFTAESGPIQNTAAIKVMFKNSRDYFLNAFKPDESRYPRDAMRNLAFIMSRDDTETGYVNPKIARKFESIRNNKKNIVGQPSDKGWFGKEVYPWMQGYINYDFLMRNTFYMLSPDTSAVPAFSHGGQTPEALALHYREMGYDTFEDYRMETRAGAAMVDESLRLALNTKQVRWLLYQSMLLLDVIPPDNKAGGETEKQRIIKSGYQLFDGSDGETPSPTGVIYDLEDVLDLAKQYNMARNYQLALAKDNNDREFIDLIRRENATPSLQYIIDRLILCTYLFDKKELQLH